MTTQNFKNTLVVDLHEQFNAKVECWEQLNKSIFYDKYRIAAGCTVEIIQKQCKAINPCGEKYPSYLRYQEQDFNNIIAFCGERGTGKTSAMLSFAAYLEHIHKDDKEVFQHHSRSLQQHHFHITDTIDPSLFENNENLFEVVLAKMFAKTIEKIQGRHENEHLEKEGKRKLLEAYSKVYKSLAAIHTKEDKRYEGEALETLSKLSSGANLRDDFKKLVKEYLTYHKKNSCSRDPLKHQDILVIPIDDFDLNTKAATDMGEQIRKYLMIPNVVILMAVNMEQLTNVKEQDIRTSFKTMIDAKRLYEDPKEFAVNYLIKLIPHNRRIHLNATELFVKTTALQLINWKHEPLPKNPKDDDGSTEISIEEFILQTIYQLTGLIFIAPPQEPHFLIPKTLRRLRGMLYLLNSLASKSDSINVVEVPQRNIEALIIENLKKENIQINDKELESYRCALDNLSKVVIKDPQLSEIQLTGILPNHESDQNLSRFKEYVLINYLPEILHINQVNIVENFINTTPKCKNKHLIQNIRNYLIDTAGKKNKIEGDMCAYFLQDILFIKENKRQNSHYDLLMQILNTDNKSDNISLRDVLYFINTLENCIYIDHAKQMIQAIKLIYSIELYGQMINEDTLCDAQTMIGESIVPLIKEMDENHNGDNSSVFLVDILSSTNFKINSNEDKSIIIPKELQPFLTYYPPNYSITEKSNSRPQNRRSFTQNYALQDVQKQITPDTFILLFDLWKPLLQTKDNKFINIFFHSIDLIESIFSKEINILTGKSDFDTFQSLITQVLNDLKNLNLNANLKNNILTSFNNLQNHLLRSQTEKESNPLKHFNSLIIPLNRFEELLRDDSNKDKYLYKLKGVSNLDATTKEIIGWITEDFIKHIEATKELDKDQQLTKKSSIRSFNEHNFIDFFNISKYNYIAKIEAGRAAKIKETAIR
ncbi:hypothetical protein K5X82_00600 [Halosquirtibacter xylanolyticus]|uniref:hypothetical protein n=1 Tax=Halosquirtibacter xylanolyticus TaxID=3374599 RepID=UPI0037499A52|nr:hypothetical protein K5X82_00600 [Prolixibacteraceae bacterium]